MKYYFLNSGAHTGKFNMDLDVALAEHCADDEFYFRLYTWQPYCLSLGANQNDSMINMAKLKEHSIDIVQRPSGGKAILHAQELTYSVVCHTNSSFTPQQIYRTINEALLLGLSVYDTRLQTAEMEQVQPDFRSLFNKQENFACFSSSAKNELKFDHKKLIGSAQRKMGNVVLQHGSLLCGTFHKRITEFLNCDANTIQVVQSDLAQKTVELETVLNEQVDYSRLEDALKTGFEMHFSSAFEETDPQIILEKLQFEEINNQ